MHTFLGWLRVGLLIVVGGILFSPLILLNVENFRTSRSREVSEAARTFFRALTENDRELLKSVLHPAAQWSLVPSLVSNLYIGNGIKVEIKRTHLENATAQVEFALSRDPNGSVTLTKWPNKEEMKQVFEQIKVTLERLDGQRGSLQLSLSDKKVHVTGLVFPLAADGTGPFINFIPQPNDPLNPGARSKTDHTVYYRLLVPVTPQEIDRVWQRDFDFKNEPVETVVNRLAKELDLMMVWPPEKPNRQEQLVTVNLKQHSRLGAIAQVLDRAKMNWTLGRTSLLMAYPKSQVPSVIAGPFRVQIKQQKEHSPDATGVLTLSADVVEMSPPIRQLFDRMGPVVRDDTAPLADGRNLVFHERFPRLPRPKVVYSTDSIKGPGQSCEWLVPLRNLTADLREIPSLKGRIGFRFPTKVDETTWQVGKPGKIMIGDVELEITKLDKPAPGTSPSQNQQQWKLVAKGPPNRYIGMMAVDSAGKATGGWWMIPPHTMPLDLSITTVALKIRVAVLDTHTYPFEFTNIPLVDRPPVQLAELKHPDNPSPVTITIRKVTAPRYSLTITNHSSKAVEQIQILVRALDAKNKELTRKSVPIPQRTLVESAYWNPESILNYAWVRANSTFPTVLDFDAPEKTSHLAVTVERIIFTDGSTWTSPAP